MNHLPTIDPLLFTTSSVVVGYLLIGQLTGTEQNALGNWFAGVGQILLTNGGYQLVLEARNLEKEEINDIDPIEMLQKVVDTLEGEIADLKKKVDKNS